MANSEFKNALMATVSEAADKIEKLYVEPANEIDGDSFSLDSETDTYQFEDRAATKLVLDDFNYADNYINVLQWASAWTMSDILYQSPTQASAFDGGNVAQANVPKFWFRITSRRSSRNF